MTDYGRQEFGGIGSDDSLEADEDSELVRQEFYEYGLTLGVDIQNEPELEGILLEGFNAEPPPNFRVCEHEDGQTYFFDTTTAKSQWEHPMDEYYRERVLEERARIRAGHPPSHNSGGGSTPRRQLSPHQMSQLSPRPRGALELSPPSDVGSSMELSPVMQQQLQMRQMQHM
eukprot:scpid102332/ scgid3754/ Centrosomal protein of 164 kDa